MTKRAKVFLVIVLIFLTGLGLRSTHRYLARHGNSHPSRSVGDARKADGFPSAVDPAKVGTYPAFTKSGAGYFYDDVLEYRVWIHPKNGGDDHYQAFAEYRQALDFSRQNQGAEEPLVLVRQNEWIDEPESGKFAHKKGERITEWQVEWLRSSRRTPDSIADFLREKQGVAEKTTKVR
jgi:hypothetical protein